MNQVEKCINKIIEILREKGYINYHLGERGANMEKVREILEKTLRTKVKVVIDGEQLELTNKIEEKPKTKIITFDKIGYKYIDTTKSKDKRPFRGISYDCKEIWIEINKKGKSEFIFYNSSLEYKKDPISERKLFKILKSLPRKDLSDPKYKDNFDYLIKRGDYK